MENNAKSCLVIGAGISGLFAAAALQNAGLQTIVLDKGRGVGGRMATRRIENGVFDHGAQFFTVREPRFQKIVDDWLKEGIAAKWSHGFASETGAAKSDGYPRYRGIPSMTGIPKALAKTLNLRIANKVERIERIDRGWRITVENGAMYSAEGLVLTAPVPQSLILLDAGAASLPADTRQALENISYDPCIAMMILTENPLKVPEPGAVQRGAGVIRWAADNTRKGVSPDAYALTIHTSSDFSRAHWETDKEIIAEILLVEAGHWIDGPVRSWQIHKWRYSQPQQAYPERWLMVDAMNLVFAGDAFGGPRVEGAVMSGLAAGEKMALKLLAS